MKIRPITICLMTVICIICSGASCGPDGNTGNVRAYCRNISGCGDSVAFQTLTLPLDCGMTYTQVMCKGTVIT
jgi:hypothetical protein